MKRENVQKIEIDRPSSKRAARKGSLGEIHSLRPGSGKKKAPRRQDIRRKEEVLVRMKKEEVRNKILNEILGRNVVGKTIYMSKAVLTQQNKIITNWSGEIAPKTNIKRSKSWFCYIDHDPSANFEHPVEYIFIDDKSGEFEVITGNTPPDNLDELERIA